MPAPRSLIYPQAEDREVPEEVDRGCLQRHPPGCNRITTMGQCLSSTDGREVESTHGLKIRGERCVWCNGVRCTSGSSSLCEPYDYVMHGEGTAFGVFSARGNFKVATCAKRTVAALRGDFGCLEDAPYGCPSLKDAVSCLSHRDGRRHALMDGLRVHGEPCMWCGGSPCHSNSGNLCEPYDWVRNGKGHAFEVFSSARYWIAGCRNGRPAARTEKTWPMHVDGYTPVPGRPAALLPSWVPWKPHADELQCLQASHGGCDQLRDMASCMTSRDGRQAPKFEPCVWCGGVACTSNSTSVCEPFDFVMYGEGKAFARFMAKNFFRVAGCSRIRAPLPKFNYDCLKPSSDRGCRGIRDAYTCLTSKDNSAVTKIGAYSVRNQPCVWCGGGPCRSGSQSVLCEAFDYAVNGEQSAFDFFEGWGTYRLGACRHGVPRPATATNFSDFVPGSTWSPSSSGAKLPVLKTPALGAGPTVRPFWWVPERPRGAELDCLEDHARGCWAIEERNVCLGSKDGRALEELSGLKVHGEPCVWCGGGHCRSDSGSLCEPFDFLMHGEGKAFGIFKAKMSFSVAHCQAGNPFVPATDVHPLPSPDMLFPPQLATREQWWIPPRPTEANMTCLAEQSRGCSALRDMGACLSSRDGRTERRADGLKIHREPCVWCNGGQCHSNGTTYCEPFDYLMRGEGKAFSTFYATGSSTVASCKPGPSTALPSFVDVACLQGSKAGCNSLRDAGSCLASKDGRPDVTIDGLKVHDQPCVWCGGGVCHSANDNMCEPFDWIMNGEKKAFVTFMAKKNFRFAGCKDGRAAAMTPEGFAETVPGYVEPVARPPPLVPHWVPRRPTEASMSCLSDFADGCEAIGDEKVCLSSRDGRSRLALRGLKIRGEPCVWCGGGPCRSGSRSPCEPFDFLMHGQGRAFDVFAAKASFSVAHCKAGKPVLPAHGPPRLPRGALLETAGAAAFQHADCWHKCGERAGICRWCGGGRACCNSRWVPYECWDALLYPNQTGYKCVHTRTSFGRGKQASAGNRAREGQAGPHGAAQTPAPEDSTPTAGARPAWTTRRRRTRHFGDDDWGSAVIRGLELQRAVGFTPGPVRSAATAPAPVAGAGATAHVPEFPRVAAPSGPGAPQVAMPVHLGRGTRKATTGERARGGARLLWTGVLCALALLSFLCMLLLYLLACREKKPVKKRSVVRQDRQEYQEIAFLDDNQESAAGVGRMRLVAWKTGIESMQQHLCRVATPARSQLS